jgi:hypothetical protein
MEQIWLNPVRSSSAMRPGPALNQDMVRVASEVAPTVSPAPAGNAFVPAGFVLQMADDTDQDMTLGDTRSGVLQYDATMSPITVPIASGGWPSLGPGFPTTP